MKTIQQLAQEYSNMFETKQRPNGDKFLCVKDKHDQEQWNHTPLARLIHHIHDDMLPDDYKYQFLVESLNAIAECSDLDEIQLESDIYNHELLKWVSSHSQRVAYCDEVLGMFSLELNFMQIVSNAQYIEKDEVLQETKQFLTEILEAQNNG